MSVMSKRKKYGEQFKAEAVELVLITGRSIVEVAGELGVNPGTLGNWLRLHREANPDPVKALSPVDSARLKAVEAENANLRLENEFLKKRRPSSPRRRIEREGCPDRC